MAPASAYPSGAATIDSAPSAPRSRETWCCTALRGAAGTCSPHKASASTSTGTMRPPRKANSASSVRRLGPVISAGRPPTKTLNGPRSRISSEEVMAAGLGGQASTARRACKAPQVLPGVQRSALKRPGGPPHLEAERAARGRTGHAASPAHPSRTSLATSRGLIWVRRRAPVPRASRGWPWSARGSAWTGAAAPRSAVPRPGPSATAGRPTPCVSRRRGSG